MKIINIICVITLALGSCKNESHNLVETGNYLTDNVPKLANFFSKLTVTELEGGVPYSMLYAEFLEEGEIVVSFDVKFFLPKKHGSNLELQSLDDEGNLLFSSSKIVVLTQPSKKQHYYWEVQFYLSHKKSRMTIDEIKDLNLIIRTSDGVVELPAAKRLIRGEVPVRDL